jgi:hypothetical protein
VAAPRSTRTLWVTRQTRFIDEALGRDWLIEITKLVVVVSLEWLVRPNDVAKTEPSSKDLFVIERYLIIDVTSTCTIGSYIMEVVIHKSSSAIFMTLSLIGRFLS